MRGHYDFENDEFYELEDEHIAQVRRIIGDTLGAEIQNSVFVKAILDNAEQDAINALFGLANVDATNTAGVQALQAQVQRARDIARWIIPILREADQATEELAGNRENADE